MIFIIPSFVVIDFKVIVSASITVISPKTVESKIKLLTAVFKSIEPCVLPTNSFASKVAFIVAFNDVFDCNVIVPAAVIVAFAISIFPLFANNNISLAVALIFPLRVKSAILFSIEISFLAAKSYFATLIPLFEITILSFELITKLSSLPSLSPAFTFIVPNTYTPLSDINSNFFDAVKLSVSFIVKLSFVCKIIVSALKPPGNICVKSVCVVPFEFVKV